MLMWFRVSHKQEYHDVVLLVFLSLPCNLAVIVTDNGEAQFSNFPEILDSDSADNPTQPTRS